MKYIHVSFIYLLALLRIYLCTCTELHTPLTIFVSLIGKGTNNVNICTTQKINYIWISSYLSSYFECSVHV